MEKGNLKIENFMKKTMKYNEYYNEKLEKLKMEKILSSQQLEVVIKYIKNLMNILICLASNYDT